MPVGGRQCWRQGGAVAPVVRPRRVRAWPPRILYRVAVLSAICLPIALHPAQITALGALPVTFRAIDLSGVLLNGILGALIARRKNFDLVGFVVLAILTATAGGILRDVMIQNGPPFALTDPYYLYAACAGAVIAWVVPFTSRPARRFLVVADAVVLGVWAATGATKALANGLGVMPALLLGCLTAVGGSMIRDVSVGETPAVFGGNKLYAIPALCAALTDVAMVRVGFHESWGILVATLVGAGMCLLAYWRFWQLPVVGDREMRRRARGGAGARPARWAIPSASAIGWRRGLMGPRLRGDGARRASTGDGGSSRGRRGRKPLATEDL